MVIAAVLIVVTLAGGGWYYWLNHATNSQTSIPGGRDRVTPIVVEAAITQDFPVRLSAIGTVVPRTTITVRSRVDGTLDRILFKEGQTVQAGELLAEIDPRPFEVALTQAQGQMARDQALLTNARSDLVRYEGLAKLDAIPSQQLDTQAALVRQYEATVKVDQGLVDNAKLQLSYTRITASSAGRVGLRQVDPGNLVRSSDANGIVLLTQVQPVTVIFPIPESELGKVLTRTGRLTHRESKNTRGSGRQPSGERTTDGSPVQVPPPRGDRRGPSAGGEPGTRGSAWQGERRTDGGPDAKQRVERGAEDKAPSSGSNLTVQAWDRDGKALLATGELLTVDNQIDVTTGTVKVKAIFQNKDGSLFPNQFVNVRLVVNELKDATVIPSAAVQRGARGSFVWLLSEDKTVAMRPVEVGVADGDRIPVLTGLNPGEQVAVDGFDRLREGAKVEVVSRESRAVKAGPGKRGPKASGQGTPGDAGKAPTPAAPGTRP